VNPELQVPHGKETFMSTTAIQVPRSAILWPSSTPTRWAVVLCKFSDQPQEPQTVRYFEDLFTTAGENGLADYFRDMSYGKVTLAGSVVKGWYTIPLDYATAGMQKRPGIALAAQAAQNDIHFPDFIGIMAVMNAHVDSGNAGSGPLPVTGGNQVFALTNTSPGGYGMTFNAHEMGHGYGLDHSWAANPDREYGDTWDIMSASNVFYFNDPEFEGSGPSLNAPYRDHLGWMPESAKVTSNAPGSQTLRIISLNSSLSSGYRMIKVPTGPDGHVYTVELRDGTGWDQSAPAGVLVHEVRADRSYLIGGIQTAGSVVMPSAGDVSITVAGVDAGFTGATVTVNRTALAPTWAAQELDVLPEGIVGGPAVSSWGPGRLDVVVRNGGNGYSHRFYHPDGGWRGWEDLGGGFTSDPAVASWGPNRLDVFGRGLDGRIWHKNWNGRGWFPQNGGGPVWELVGDQPFASAPAVASWGFGRLDVFVRGTDDQLYHAFSESGPFSRFEPLGIYLQDDPAVASWGPNRLDVFGREKGTSQLVHMYWDFHRGNWYPRDGAGRLAWEPLGGVISSAPGASSWGFGRLDVFALGGADTWHLAYSTGGWTAWEDLGVKILSAPRAASWGPERIDVFAKAQDGRLEHQSFSR
jgi:hypothetical protein